MPRRATSGGANLARPGSQACGLLAETGNLLFEPPVLLLPLGPPPQSTGLPLCLLMAPQGTGVCHSAAGLWEPLSGAGHTADLWRWFHASVGLWVGGSLEACAGDFGLGWDELPEEAGGRRQDRALDGPESPYCVLAQSGRQLP